MSAPEAMPVTRKVLVGALIVLALVAAVFVVLALEGLADFLEGQDRLQNSFGD